MLIKELLCWLKRKGKDHTFEGYQVQIRCDHPEIKGLISWEFNYCLYCNKRNNEKVTPLGNSGEVVIERKI